MLVELGFHALRLAARHVPPRLGYRLCRAGAPLYAGISPAKRAAVAANLRHVEAWTGSRGPGVERLTRATFESHGMLIYEWLRDGAGVHIEFDGLEHLRSAAESGRGAVVATCHLGNWEVAAVELAKLGFQLYVVTGEQLGRLGSAVRAHKARRGIHVVRALDGMRPLFAALGRGGIVALLIDGDVYTRGEPTPFFDDVTHLPFGAARLAQRTGSDLLPAAMVRTGPLSYRVTIRPPVPQQKNARLMMQAVLRALESAIAAHPEQWCLFRPLWRTTGKESLS